MKTIRRIGMTAFLVVVGAIGPRVIHAQRAGAAGPLAVAGLANELYVGYEHTRFDYGLVNADGSTTILTANGVNAQYAYRERDHMMIVASGRYTSGKPLAVTTMAAGAGVGYVADWRRYEPFAQATFGYSRLKSNDPNGIYLSTKPLYGFTTTFGAGVDVNLTDRFGIRPVYVENQFLPFGSRHSVEWSISSGLLVRFHGFGRRRAW